MYIHNEAQGGPSAVSEATLFRRAQAGCPASLNALINPSLNPFYPFLTVPLLRKPGAGLSQTPRALS